MHARYRRRLSAPLRAVVHATSLAGRRLRALVTNVDPAPLDYPFVHSDVARLHQLRPDAQRVSLDAATWDDLLCDRYLDTLSPGVSIFGQQALYLRLRQGVAAPHRNASAARIAALAADPMRMEALTIACAPLRQADCEVAGMLFGDEVATVPAWDALTWLLMLVVPAVVATIFVQPWCALLLLALVVGLISVQAHHDSAISQWTRTTAALQAMLVASARLGAQSAEGFAGVAPLAPKIGRGLVRSPWFKLFPLLRDYLDWFTLANLRHYFASVRLAQEHGALLRTCYDLCATLDADLALARHVCARPEVCWARFGAARTLMLEGMIHPLLAQAEPLSLALQGDGAFITGQNGSGKSTLMRSVGLNLAVARGFGFCYARSALLPDLPVFTSMQSEDSLLGGESLFLAELRRARELIEAAGNGAVILVDEIFRGTNYAESVSGAVAVLEKLTAHALVVASSHNVVLARLLAGQLTALCMGRDDAGVLTLAPGVLEQTNAIALLADHGMDGAVHARALEVFKWLNDQAGVPSALHR